jgi:hypothetical protein
VSAATLEAALHALGIVCTVEASDRLAIVLPSNDASRFDEAGVRAAAIALLRSHGFTHLAVELGVPDPSDPRHDSVEPTPPPTERAPVHRD